MNFTFSIETVISKSISLSRRLRTSMKSCINMYLIYNDYTDIGAIDKMIHKLVPRKTNMKQQLFVQTL